MSVKSSITGRFVKAADALLNPDTTYTVKQPRPSSGKDEVPDVRWPRLRVPATRSCRSAYPYEDGDLTVLGPGIFAGTDDGETVINFQGENYVRQETMS